MFTLGRKIDINYPTNRWIVIIALILTGGSYYITREFSQAWKFGVSIFLTWALTREIDPKREYAAFVSVLFALVGLFVAFKVNLMEIFFLLLFLRFSNEITGKNNTILDFITLFGLAAFLSYTSQTSGYLLILLIGMFLNIDNKENKRMITVFFLITTIVLFVQLFTLNGIRFIDPIFGGTWVTIFSVVSIFVYLIFILIDKEKTILGDKGEVVEGQTILQGQLFFYIAIIFLFLFTKVSIGNRIIYFSSIWGYIVYGGVMILKDKKSR